MTPVIEVLIGLSFVYLIFSLIASAVHEGLAGLFGWRSSYLERGIRLLLGADDAPNGHTQKRGRGIVKANQSPGLADDFLAHELIRSLGNRSATLPFNRKPSYISASTFTETVLDLVRKSQPPARAGSSAPTPAVTTNDLVLSDLRARLQADKIAEKEAPILQASLRILADAAKDLEDFKKRVDGWFEEAMNRVSGWYKRFSRLMVFLIGIVLVCVVNADTINIATSLWRNAPIRAAVVEQAGTVARGEQPDPGQAQEQLRKLEELNLPLGWATGPGREADPRRWPVRPAEYPIKLLGLLLTAIALSLGATFWFDFLKKFVGVRSSGAEPQPAQTGPPSGGAEEAERLRASSSVGGR